MDDIVRRATRYSCFFMSICLVAWVFVPEGRAAFAGMALGTAFSLYNTYLLRRRVERIGLAASGQKVRRASLGMGIRLAAVLFAVMIAYKFPDYFHPAAVLGACFFTQIAVFIAAFVQLIESKNRTNRKG